MKQFFKFMFASMLGFLLSGILLIVIFIALVSSAISNAGKEEDEVGVKENSVLHIDFGQEIVDRASKNPLENFDFMSFKPNESTGLDKILENLEKAAADTKIKGIFLDITNVPAGIATVEEIRNALIEFKKSKKFIVAYSEIYTQKTYYLTSVADKIYLNPQGAIEIKGLGGEIMFYKGALEKLEIEPQIIRHGKFKSAVEPYMLDKMSDANREQTHTFINSIWQQIISGIAKERKISTASIQEMADNMLVQSPEDALKYKLVDKLLYRDEVTAELKGRLGVAEKDKLALVDFSSYFNTPTIRKYDLATPKIAVIYATGAIESGEGDDKTIGSERISKAIAEARKDEKVKAIVLRVNSPGGSALASDVIWREVVLAKKVKPVVVSMGDVAASGGYYIACAANKIYASPNTITGSIGVFGVMFNGQKFLNNKLGITIDTVKTGKHSDLGSIYRPLTADERAVIQQEVEHVYDVFTKKVAEGRKKTQAEIDSIGQGRVWSGVDAIKIGLIDAFGGLNDAIADAAKMAKLDKYRIYSLPKQKSTLESLFKKTTENEEARVMERELGLAYKYYKNLQDVLKSQGIQARLPYSIDIH
jgi:protease-4